MPYGTSGTVCRSGINGAGRFILILGRRMICLHYIHSEGKVFKVLSENEKATPEDISQECDQHIVTPYRDREMTERVMTGMMQEMRNGAERTDILMKEHGLSREEAESYI